VSTPRVPTLREQISTAPGGAFLARATPTDPTGYVITVTAYSPEPEQLLRLELGEWDYFRAASAGHRLIEAGFSVLPAAHYEPDRAAGWKNGADALSFTAPVYRLPAPAAFPIPGAQQLSDPGNPTTTAIELLQGIESLAVRWEGEGHHEDAATVRRTGPEFVARLSALIAEDPAEMLPLARQELDAMLTALRSKSKSE
jgi:hypothetical protein